MSVRLRADVSTTDTDNGAVLLDLRSGRYWQLNPSAAMVLRALLDGGVEDAVRRLTEAYAVPVERARDDAGALLDQLVRAGLVVS
ncbi:hypothetical protein Lesp02_38450 [Lentzea sp. NBRC 105346]|uniref:lasso peptide biosynthesis PqqD family chaperone n=1 Tax=Lentzea sp. NBRC 105346 TaxID=3032205 RepID=UPI0024A445B9|nr:lasso peptide biosynthesis PqqD family chaperone [Lentzea sp. NBRC 105346]GLZ31657.1 hypothetical protein Lesp02_38450 [Lentzea sp. NBRC 105346]